MSVAAGAPGATARLAAYCATLEFAALPEPVRAAAVRAWLNWVACALGGAADAVSQQAWVALDPLAASGRCWAATAARRVDAVNAAMVNAIAANALDFDDMHVPTLIHPTGAVVAAALACAQSAAADGRRLLAAVVAGIETELRIGSVLFPRHYDTGFHTTATAGTLGAAAAAARALGLSARRTARALGIAATSAAGLRCMLSNPCKSFNIGRAAASGVTAALMAAAGFGSTGAVLEERHGFLDAHGARERADEVVDGLGAHFLLPEASFKPYPCGVVIHPLIDACLEIAGREGFVADQVSALEARVAPRALELADRPHPANALLGRFSLQHAAALALAGRGAGYAAFESGAVDDPLLQALRSCMRLSPDASLHDGQTRVTVRAGGREFHAGVEHPRGSPARPLTDQELRAKFVELAAIGRDERAAQRIHRSCADIAARDDLAAFDPGAAD